MLTNLSELLAKSEEEGTTQKLKINLYKIVSLKRNMIPKRGKLNLTVSRRDENFMSQWFGKIITMNGVLVICITVIKIGKEMRHGEYFTLYQIKLYKKQDKIQE